MTTRSFILLSLLLVVASADGGASAAASDSVETRSLQEESVQLPADCLDLLAASANEYGKLKKENYFVFTDGMSNGYFSSNDVRSYDGLPAQNKFGFVTLACACRDRGDRSDCCQGNRARLDVSGIDDPETMPTRTRAYVMDICSVTSEAIGDNKLPPTGELPATTARPVASPTTVPPTKSPTSAYAFAAAVSSRSAEEGNDRGGIPGIAWLGVAVAGAFLFALFLYHLYGEDKQVEAREVRPATAVWMDKMHETATRIAERRRENAERRREERDRKSGTAVVLGERDGDERPPASPDGTASTAECETSPTPSERTAPWSGSAAATPPGGMHPPSPRGDRRSSAIIRAALGRMIPSSARGDGRSSASYYPNALYLSEGRDESSDDSGRPATRAEEDDVEEGDATRGAKSREPARVEWFSDAVSERAAANWGMRPASGRGTRPPAGRDGGGDDDAFFREMSERQESLRLGLQSDREMSERQESLRLFLQN